MKISIVVPVYNVEKYLSKCLESLISQTLADIEIICINDGSTDKSLEILENYASKDNRVKIINQENQGVSTARNSGLACANGEYVTFVDSDDWLESNSCEELYNKAIQTNSDIVLFSHYDVFPNKKTPYNLANDCEEGTLKFDNVNNYIEKVIYVPATTWGKLYKREFLSGTIFQTNLKIYEDTYFWFNTLERLPQITVVNKHYYNYLNVRESSALNKIETALSNYKKSLDFIINSEFYKNCKLDGKMLIYDKLMNYFCWMWIKHRSERDLLVNDLKFYMEKYEKFGNDKVRNLRNYQKLKKHLQKYKFKSLSNMMSFIFSINNDEHRKNKIVTFLGYKIKV